jgi:hypothetical protein
LDEPLDAVFLGGPGGVLGPAEVDRLVHLLAAVGGEQRRERDEVDHGVAAVDGPRDAVVVGHVARDGVDAAG